MIRFLTLGSIAIVVDYTYMCQTLKNNYVICIDCET